MKRTFWQPLVLGTALGVVAAIATVTGLSFLSPGITDNAIGFYVTLLLLAAALGGPLAGALAASIFVVSSTLFGPTEMKVVLGDPITFWSNLLAVVTTVALAGFAYRLIFERLRMPVRLLAWAAIVIAYYVILVPYSVVLQYWLHGIPTSEILPAVRYGYETYFPQAIFDIFTTSLIFIALPVRYRRPLWCEPGKAQEPSEEIQNEWQGNAP